MQENPPGYVVTDSWEMPHRLHVTIYQHLSEVHGMVSSNEKLSFLGVVYGPFPEPRPYAHEILTGNQFVLLHQSQAPNGALWCTDPMKRLYVFLRESQIVWEKGKEPDWEEVFAFQTTK